MKAIWQMWEGELSDELVNKIIKECEYYDLVESKTGFRDEGQEAKHETRRSKVRWINPNDKNSYFIADLLWDYAKRANREVFGVDLTGLWDIQYTIYEGSNNGHYAEHFDTFWANPTMHDRKLSVTIQLSDSDDYEGGDFVFDQEYQSPDPKALRKKGTILVFPSPIRHAVKPVTKGIRKSLVAWVEGPKWRQL